MFWKNFSFAGGEYIISDNGQASAVPWLLFFSFSLRAWKQLFFFFNLIFILFPHTLEILRFKFDLGGFAEQFLWVFVCFLKVV